MRVHLHMVIKKGRSQGKSAASDVMELGPGRVMFSVQISQAFVYTQVVALLFKNLDLEPRCGGTHP